MTRTLHLLSAGAARGIAQALQPAFEAQHDARIVAQFGAVGAIAARLAAGEPCDVIALTAAMIDALAREGRVQIASVAPLGVVRTGVAVRSGDPRPAIGDAAQFAQALLEADEVHVPDVERSTAGIHFARVLEQLGIRSDVASRLRPAPNGALAMAALAQSAARRPIGCTQVSEILYTEGVALAGTLPPALGLATVYAVAVTTDAPQADLARRFVSSLAGDAAATLRAAAGFEPLCPLSAQRMARAFQVEDQELP